MHILGINPWLLVLLALVLYFGVEHAPWHASRDTEYTYLFFVGLLTTVLAVYDSNSPLILLSELLVPVRGVGITAATALAKGHCHCPPCDGAAAAAAVGDSSKSSGSADEGAATVAVELPGSEVGAIFSMTYDGDAGVAPENENVVGERNALNHVVAVLVIVGTVILSEARMERRTRSQLSKAQLGLAGIRAASMYNSLHARATAMKVSAVVDEITYGTGGLLIFAALSRMLTWWKPGKMDPRRKQLHRLLKGETAAVLNFVMVETNVAQLINVCSADTMDMLCSPSKRLPDLCTAARAALINAFQKSGMRYSSVCRSWVVDIITNTRGDALSELKNLLDQGSYNNSYKLVYEDVSDEGDRQRVLAHFAQEAAAIPRRPGPGALRRVVAPFRAKGPMKILSDVDDTLYCSGGKHLAGVDVRYPSKAVYPGVLAFYRELDRFEPAKRSGFGSRTSRSTFDARGGHRSSAPTIMPVAAGAASAWFQLSAAALADKREASNPVDIAVRLPSGEVATVSVRPEETVAQVQKRIESQHRLPGSQQRLLFSGTSTPCNLVFLSARPHAYKDYTESYSYALFRDLVDSGRMHGMPTLLAGGLSEGFDVFRKALMGRNDVGIWRDVGIRKFRSFRDYQRVFAEHEFAFVCDNGQGDVLASEMMLRHTPDAVRAVFVHRVIPPHETLSTANGKVNPVHVEAVLRGTSETEADEHAAGSEANAERDAADGTGGGAEADGTASAEATVADSAASGAAATVAPGSPTTPPMRPSTRDATPPPSASGRRTRADSEAIEPQTQLGPHATDDDYVEHWAQQKIFFFSSYAGAAAAARKCGLLDNAALGRVVRAVHDDLMELFVTYPHWRWMPVVAEVNGDIRAANELLPEEMRVPAVPDRLTFSKRASFSSNTSGSGEAGTDSGGATPGGSDGNEVDDPSPTLGAGAAGAAAATGGDTTAPAALAGARRPPGGDDSGSVGVGGGGGDGGDGGDDDIAAAADAAVEAHLQEQAAEAGTSSGGDTAAAATGGVAGGD